MEPTRHMPEGKAKKTMFFNQNYALHMDWKTTSLQISLNNYWHESFLLLPWTLFFFSDTHIQVDIL